ncbi:DENN domain-containing protein [Lentinula aciculospora]|uniref:DENN domain-containing protein n=1 Tax=Lentinula aciculospora TaxID=153920 RepID=A0A9W9AML9_9AGAR|nr:DENN domain-containing protein [Lentinula aciculospora]
MSRNIAEHIIRPRLSEPAMSGSRGKDANIIHEELEDDFVNISRAAGADLHSSHTGNKAARVLGLIQPPMSAVLASGRNSIVSTRSARDALPSASITPSLPLASLYLVSGLPKSPHTWTLADPDAVLGLHHSDGAVNRWWRPEVLGSTVSPGAGGGKKKRRGKAEEIKGAGALSKSEVGKMLSKALKLSFCREVEVIASTLQPASTVHTFTFTLPAPNTPLAPTPSGDLLRTSVLSDNRSSVTPSFSHPYYGDPFARPSSTYLGGPRPGSSAAETPDMFSSGGTITYHGVCLLLWSHADAERSTAIRRTLEASRSRKESNQSSLVTSRLKNLRSDALDHVDPTSLARKSARKSARGPWADAETDAETEAEGGISESEYEVASTVGHGPGESTLFLPGDTVFWLPYALTLVSRYPVYDLMRDYLTLSWARFSKDVQSHTLQISKILAHPAPRAGELIRLDASPSDSGHGSDNSLEVIARFPGGLDFGRGLVDINFTMWPLFKCLNIENILTICEIALAPTGRILFFSRHPAMLGIAVMTIKYLVELRGWNGIALPAVHSRDAKIYIDDPGPWIIGLATEARYSVRPSPEVCICDLDINSVNCMSPPPGCVSTKQQREKYRQRLQTAFDQHYHPDHSIPVEFKEAFPAGRFRPLCKIQAKRGASAAAVADQIKPPEWWHSTRIIQAFDSVLQEKYKKPSLLRRIGMFGAVRRPPQLTASEQMIQLSIRKRATAFVDARDDLETKIGRLSRRLNFLMTESDLWRDKFVTFETYAEKLSAEANQLRAKINKEQRETKRLSGLVTMTAAEKSKLQNQLKETESAHQEALNEMVKMKENMETMELERADMIAEVEAQIERALASMAVGVDDSDYGSRPSSRLSNASSAPRSRRPSDASKARHLRSFGTESTLAESYEDEDFGGPILAPTERANGTIQEDQEEEEAEEAAAVEAKKKKRFSASEVDAPQDGMVAVDQGITEKSDKIAQKVLEIQAKLEKALSTERRTAKWRGNISNQESEGELEDSESVTAIAPPPRPPRAHRKTKSGEKKTRKRSNTASSTQTSRSATTAQDEDDTIPTPPVSTNRKPLSVKTSGTSTPTHRATSSREQSSVRKIASGASLSATRPLSLSQITPSTPALSPGLHGTTDESDTDFQSAYSVSPRGSYHEYDQHSVSDEERPGITERGLPVEFGKHPSPVFVKPRRERFSSTSTATATGNDLPSPTHSEATISS